MRVLTPTVIEAHWRLARERFLRERGATRGSIHANGVCAPNQTHSCFAGATVRSTLLRRQRVCIHSVQELVDEESGPGSGPETTGILQSARFTLFCSALPNYCEQLVNN